MKKVVCRLQLLFWFTSTIAVNGDMIYGSEHMFSNEFQHVNGHGEPFGKNRPSNHVQIIEDYLDPKSFFMHYVFQGRAVLLKKAVYNSPAVRLWSDDYFLKITVPRDNMVLVENKKKENRTAPPTSMHFKDFVGVYNLTDQYMVEPVPEFLRQDVLVPGPIQCKQILETAVVEAMMWFSSGGTKSVVHTDSVENINCVIRGKKKFVFVSPEYKRFVLMDHPEGAYSGIDVDAVDYTKYPGLSKVEYMHADVAAGDCLYIPYKWVHQVESFDRNIAVNIWWDTYKNHELNLEACPESFDERLTLDRVTMHGFEVLDSSPAVIRDHIQEILMKGAISITQFQQDVLQVNGKELEHEEHLFEEFMEYVRRAFALLDRNEDNLLDLHDIRDTSNDEWSAIASNMVRAMKLISNLEPAAENGMADDIYGRDEL